MRMPRPVVLSPHDPQWAQQAEALMAELRALVDVAAEAARIDGLRAELEAIRGERVAVTAGVNAGLLRKYDTVLQRRNGVAVVTVEDGRTCGGCHMQVPPQALIEIRRSASVQVCPNCQRILYVPAE